MITLLHSLVFWRWELVERVKSVDQVWIATRNRLQRYFVLLACIVDFIHVVIKSLVQDHASMRLSIVKLLQLHLIIERNRKSVRLRQNDSVIIKILSNDVREHAHIEVDEYFLRALVALLFALLLLFERHQLIGLDDNVL